MASQQPTLKLFDIEWGKLISTTFPGLLLSITVYMLVDLAAKRHLTADAFGGEPEVLAASITSLVILSTFLGVFVDAIGHVLFENTVREHLFGDFDDKRKAKLMPYPQREAGFGAIYRVLVDPDLRKEQIDSHYRYIEFSVNGALALVPFSLVFPVYLLSVLQFSFGGSIGAALGMAAVTALMAVVAVHNTHDWEEVRDELVVGTLEAIKRKASGGTAIGTPPEPPNLGCRGRILSLIRSPRAWFGGSPG